MLNLVTDNFFKKIKENEFFFNSVLLKIFSYRIKNIKMYISALNATFFILFIYFIRMFLYLYIFYKPFILLLSYLQKR